MRLSFVSSSSFLVLFPSRYWLSAAHSYIGNVVVSINPYHQLKIYSGEHIKLYQNVYLYELPPHIFALSDQAYRSMRDELLDQVNPPPRPMPHRRVVLAPSVC
jgi:myosin-1